ncbi:hypothetical protein M0804_006088 [Polistes exclamans]|nr:hypothetical protein M0804_006088 [Polistes exclamans]
MKPPSNAVARSTPKASRKIKRVRCKCTMHAHECDSTSSMDMGKKGRDEEDHRGHGGRGNFALGIFPAWYSPRQFGTASRTVIFRINFPENKRATFPPTTVRLLVNIDVKILRKFVKG